MRDELSPWAGPIAVPSPQELADRYAVSQLVKVYALGVDMRDLDLVLSVFAPDAFCEGMAGAMPAKEYLPSVFAGAAAYPVTQHNVTNQHVVIDGDDATCWSYAVCYHIEEAGGSRDDLVIAMQYRDHCHRFDDGWLITSRRSVMQWLRGSSPQEHFVSNRVAFITGASRGIGKVVAGELAAVGYDVAATARTVKEGEAREHSSTLKDSDLSPLPGSLDSTADLVRSKGAQALTVPADLLDPASLGAAVATVLERWGRIDVVVHNGRYIGPGHMDLFLETPIELLRKQMEGNFFAPLIINQLVLPSMIEHGGGTIVNITSASGYVDPTRPAGDGGWGMGYGTSKGAFHRIAGFLAVELGNQGIRCFNVQPGLIATERIAQDMAKFGIQNKGAPAEVMGKVVAWLCTDPSAGEYNGKNIEAQFFCHERGLLPGWPGPPILDNNIDYDHSGAVLERLEDEWRAASSGHA